MKYLLYILIASVFLFIVVSLFYTALFINRVVKECGMTGGKAYADTKLTHIYCISPSTLPTQ